MGFRDWLQMQENGTCTASIAVFARPILPIIRRSPLMGDIDDFFGGLLREPEMKDEDDKPKKKSTKKKPKKKKDD